MVPLPDVEINTTGTSIYNRSNSPKVENKEYAKVDLCPTDGWSNRMNLILKATVPNVKNKVAFVCQAEWHADYCSLLARFPLQIKSGKGQNKRHYMKSGVWKRRQRQNARRLQICGKIEQKKKRVQRVVTQGGRRSAGNIIRRKEKIINGLEWERFWEWPGGGRHRTSPRTNKRINTLYT